MLFDAYHAAIAPSALDHLDQLDEAIDSVSRTGRVSIAPRVAAAKFAADPGELDLNRL